MIIQDADARQRAIDPTKSFIIQAPAGSGKTELLTQRYLALLTRVEYPEEIIALTFTRKAASEMRDRILSALSKTQVDHWNLLENPQRLRIQTIDALCASLARQMPITSQFGSLPAIAEQPQLLYRQAVENVLANRQRDVPWRESLKKLLLHLDNQQERVANLFMSCLARRDHWLRPLFEAKLQSDPREVLELGLQKIISDNLELCDQHLSSVQKSTLFSLLQFSQPSWQELTVFPEPTLENLPYWFGVIDFCLTQAHEWRKTVTKAQGFPAPSQATNREEKLQLQSMKEQALAFLESLQNHALLLSHFQNLANSPPFEYPDAQWEICQCLLEILPALVAELTLVFRQHQQVDFTAIAHNSMQALGSIDDPSDLALRLDYKIQHILVDEFQDTSYSQFHLLEKLTAGWEPGDGRTLFVVGDPMQSIYRFRQAEVGLFLKAQHSGIGHVSLIPLQLTSNFRSCANMIDWVNKTFISVFPIEDDPRNGGVSYANADVIHPESPDGGCHFAIAQDKSSEMDAMVTTIQDRLAKTTGTIAILVKARRHLHDSLRRLSARGIRAQAIELDPLSERPVVMDLWSLTRALLHPGDRLAWFSILRAPWCGLTLSDLLALGENRTIYENILDFEDNASLSDDGKLRLAHLSHVIKSAIDQRHRLSIRDWVEKTWRELGGFAALPNEQAWKDAEQYFQFIEMTSDIENFSATEAQLQQLLASSYQPSRVQVMTIHKSKGLEFDTVILPSLEQSGGNHQDELMLWQEQTTLEGDPILLLAPIKSTEMEQDRIYQYLRREEKKKEAHENKRLLYVAVTRAKTACYFFATLEEPETSKPRSGSFLAEIWSQYRAQFCKNVVCSTHQTVEQLEELSMIHRLPSAWYQMQTRTAALEAQPNPFEFSIDTTARVTGTFVHRLLEQLHAMAPQNWSLEKLHPECWGQQLLQLGLPKSELQATVQSVEQMIQQMCHDEKAHWLFSHEHQQRSSELALQTFIGNKPRQMIIDRTFIDSTNSRWIIDFKTAPKSENPNFLLEEQQHYQHQLNLYAHALEQLGTEAIRCALYYPSFGGWIEWEYSNV